MEEFNYQAFFEWLVENKKIDLYEAMLDTEEDFTEQLRRFEATADIEKLKEEFIKQLPKKVEISFSDVPDKVRRSDLFTKILNVVDKIPRADCVEDAPDGLSVAYELEQLFNRELESKWSEKKKSPTIQSDVSTRN